MSAGKGGQPKWWQGKWHKTCEMGSAVWYGHGRLPPLLNTEDISLSTVRLILLSGDFLIQGDLEPHLRKKIRNTFLFLECFSSQATFNFRMTKAKKKSHKPASGEH